MSKLLNIKLFITKYKNNPLTIFLFKGFLFFTIWDLVIYQYIIPLSMQNWVIFRLLDGSSFLLRLIYPVTITAGTELYINHMHCVHIGIPCNGIEVMGVFACIILAYRAKLYSKILMVITGCIVVFILNTLRIVVLTFFIYNHHLKAFNINHKYIFNLVLYGILLIIFSLWSSKFGIKRVSTPN
jgi:exosortase/archaeosortase family protein